MREPIQLDIEAFLHWCEVEDALREHPSAGTEEHLDPLVPWDERARWYDNDPMGAVLCGAYVSRKEYRAEVWGHMVDERDEPEGLYGEWDDEPEGLWDGFDDDAEPEALGEELGEELAAEQAADFPPEFDELVERVAFGGPIMAGLVAAVRAGLDPVAVARAAVARAR
jgi:hypothetical protein